MPRDHIVPRFLLARWADPRAGRIVVWDRRAQTFGEVDPVDHGTVEDFNVVPTDGDGDPWLESEFLAGIENRVAPLLTQLEHVQPPRSHIRRIAKQGWHPQHVLTPRTNVGLAMFVAAQMVRSPVWREAIDRATLADIEKTTKSRIEADLEAAAGEDEIVRLKELLSLRYVGIDTPKAMQIQLSGHLAYRIGQILYERFFWSVHRFAEPLLAIGNEPVGLVSPSAHPQVGSLSQLALGRGALSVYRRLEELVDDVLDVVDSAKRIVMPFGPRHAVVLSALELLWPPGRYDPPAAEAKLYNTITAVSSRDWVVWQPGAMPDVLDRDEVKARAEKPDLGSNEAA